MVVASLTDIRGLRAAMSDVQTVIHLVTGENKGSKTDLLKVDIDSTRAVSTAAADTDVERLIYLSHLGADRASAFPTLKTKGISENYIKSSGLDYTIFRTSLVYGPSDHFTRELRHCFRQHHLCSYYQVMAHRCCNPFGLRILIGCITEVWKTIIPGKKYMRLEVVSILSIHEIVELIRQQINLRKRIITFTSSVFTILHGITRKYISIIPSINVLVGLFICKPNLLY